MEEAALADRIIVLNDGEIVKQGKPRDVFKDIKLLEKLSLDLPQSVLLANKLKKVNINIDEILSMDKMAEEICQQI